MRDHTTAGRVTGFLSLRGRLPISNAWCALLDRRGPTDLRRSPRIMLSTIGVFVVLGAAIFIYRSRAPRRVNDVNLGRMSTQWIADQRGSKPS